MGFTALNRSYGDGTDAASRPEILPNTNDRSTDTAFGAVP